MEFNINDFSNFDVNAFDFGGEPSRYPNHSFDTQASFVNTLKVWPLTITPLAIVVGGFGHILNGKEGCNYLKAEGFEVVAAEPAQAFEQIRWQQPTVVLLNAYLKIDKLLGQLQSDSLTRQIAIIVLTKGKVLNNNCQSAIYVQNFCQLAEAIEFLQSSRTSQRPKPGASYLSHKTQLSDANPLQDDYEVVISCKFLRDPELRYLVAQLIDSWTMLQVVAYLSVDTRSVINIEQLMENWEIGPAEASQVIKKLASAGLIEPLELEAEIFDPFYAVVAHPEQVNLLHKFAQALSYKQYRVALTTYLLRNNSD